MHKHGFEKERIAAMSDGVFAVAITLLVMAVGEQAADLRRLSDWATLGRSMGLFAVSFIVVSLYWIAHHNEFRMLCCIRDRWAIWLNFVFLLSIVLLPVTLTLAGNRYAVDDPQSAWMERFSLASYFLNIAVAGLLLTWFFHYAAGTDAAAIHAGHRHALDETHRRNFVPGVAYSVCSMFAFCPYVSIDVARAFIYVVPIAYLLYQAVQRGKTPDGSACPTSELDKAQ